MTRAPKSGASRRGHLVAAAVSGLLLALASPGTDLGPLAFVAIVPLCWTWRDATAKRSALLGFVAGVVFFAVHLSWTWYFGAIAIVPLVALQAAFWAAVGGAVGAFARRGIRSPFLIAALWVLAEAARTRWPLGGLAWGQVGVTQHANTVGHALASWGGVPLATFVVVAVNGFVADFLPSARADRRAATRAVAGLAGVAIVASAATAARVDLHPTGRLRFALLQGNDKNRYLTDLELQTNYLTRSHLALAQKLRGRFDIVVFPESSLATDPEADPALRAEITRIARLHHSSVLANVIDEQTRPGKAYNANRLYTPAGRLAGTYAKRHLVPFGEFVPWRDSLGFIGELQQIPHDFTPGHEIGIETVAGHRIGSVICFESAFGPLMRENAAAGAEAIVVTTNNRSYQRSANSEQHVALSQMSAAAIGRPVLHSSISGITAVIDGEGVVHQTTELFKNAVVTGSITTQRGDTPYLRWGDWVEWGSGVIAAAAVGLAIGRRRSIPQRSEGT